MLSNVELDVYSKSIVKKTAWIKVLAIGFLSLCISMIALANAAEAVDLTINNPGVCGGSLEIWIKGVQTDWKSFIGGDSYIVWGLAENDLVEMKNETPLAGCIFSGYSENNFTMPATDKTVTATFDLNAAPTDIILSTSSVDENSSVGAVVGILTTTDPNAADTHTYSIQTAGVPFQIGGAGGDELQVAGALDYETQNSYSITIRTTDSGGLTYDEVFTINLNPGRAGQRQRCGCDRYLYGYGL
jgi:uncharacterized protein YaiE (UPF0345 family)